MLNQYTNKDKILEAINAINAERYSSLDRSLFTKTPFQYSTVDLGQINSANEFHVYSGESWITGKHKVDLIEFFLTITRSIRNIAGLGGGTNRDWLCWC